jgi:acetyltransferase-like isoleucine patch superfamily enzyme
MMSFVEKAKAKWDRDADLSPSARIRRARGFLTGMVASRYWLRTASIRGSGVRVNGRMVVANDGRLDIGDGCVFRGIPTAVELSVGSNAELVIGKKCIINSGASIAATGSIRLGDRVLVGPGVMVNDTSYHDLYERHVIPPPNPVIIEDDVWIGAKASILPGVTIGRGAVVSAHALVNRNVEPFTIVSGVPATVVAKLNPKKFSVENER